MAIQSTFQNSFKTYAAMTIMERAICDVRDCLKPAARMSIYAQYLDKIWADKPYKKSQKSIASAMDHFYIHGDQALYPNLARMGKPFAMRYIIEDFQGITGTIKFGDDEAASRYTEMRLSPLAMKFFTNIEKNTIDKWYDNYTGEEQYPAVLPSVGFYNIVNGTLGIATGLSSSIPQFNLKEVNEAMIKLLWNPDIDFEEICCMPDFCTGATILNASEVKESLRVGNGKACKIRSSISYDDKTRTFKVSEIPYGVYTLTIQEQLKKIIEDTENNPGIDDFGDFSGATPHIEIYLKRGANPDKVLRYLYKNTSLQYHYGINMTMIDNGKYPKVFGWKEALQAHIDHEISVYKKSFKFDLEKIKKRINIIDGLFIALANIDEVVKTIKNSPTSAAAKEKLKEQFLLNEDQAKAILDMKLSRLAHLEVEKLQKEKEKLLAEAERIEEILNNKDLLYKEIEKGFREVANKFGDARRTKIMNMNFDGEDDDPIEEKELHIYLTNEGNLFTEEISTLYTQKRGGRGAKVRMGKDEYIIASQTSSNANVLLAFSNKGKVYSLNLAEFPTSGRVNIGEFFILTDGEQIINIAPCGKKDKYQSVVFITKNGLIKKTDFSEYKIKKSKGVIAIKLKNDDELISTLFVNNENIGFLTKMGYFLIIDIDKVNSIGRATSGVKGIKLSEGDEVVDARKIKENCKEIVSITKDSYISRTDRKDFEIGTRATKGCKIQKLKDKDIMSAFLPISDKEDITVVSNKGIITIRLSDIHNTSRGAQGNIAKKLLITEFITNLM